MHLMAAEAARYHGRAGGYAFYLLFRWLYTQIGAWSYLIYVAVIAAALWLAPAGPGPRRRP